jgi:glutamate-1-semialdehyde 2,1-aminomutase
MPGFVFHHPHWNVIKTLITQGMLERKILATNSIYPSLAHTQEQMEHYFEALEGVLRGIDLGGTEDQLRAQLSGPEAHAGFKRLN